MKRITQVLWTGSPSATRVASSVFFRGTVFQAVRDLQGRIDDLSHGTSSDKVAVEQAIVSACFIESEHPRRIASALAERAGVFLFLGGA